MSKRPLFLPSLHYMLKAGQKSREIKKIITVSVDSGYSNYRLVAEIRVCGGRLRDLGVSEIVKINVFTNKSP